MNNDAGEEGGVAQPISQLEEHHLATTNGDNSVPELVVDKETLGPSQERTELPMATDESESAGADLAATDDTPEVHAHRVAHQVQISNASSEGQPPSLPEKDNSDTSSVGQSHDQSSVRQSHDAQAPTPTSHLAGAFAGARGRSESRASTVNGGQKFSSLNSMLFVTTALENIAASKEGKRKGNLNMTVQNALAEIKKDGSPNPEHIFEPLRLATETSSIPLTTLALDCIGKLISYSYFSVPAMPLEGASEGDQRQTKPLIERAIDTICECGQDEATPAELQLQIVKSLLAAVLNDKIIVHGAGLLKAVRQIYNTFLISKSGLNQQVAQGTLTQMVGTVFERVKHRLALKEARVNMGKLASGRATASASQTDLAGTSSNAGTADHEEPTEVDASSETASTLPPDQPVKKDPGEKLTLQSFENTKNFDDTRIREDAPTMVTRASAPSRRSRPTNARTASNQDSESLSHSANGYPEHLQHEYIDEDEEDEIYVKDAFLVFRSMCRLSTKILSQDQLQDLKNREMRSKLISLSIIRTCLNNNIDVFTSPLVTIRSSVNNEPASFGQAVNQYLRLALSRNGASSVRPVFETGCEIFWLMLRYMRVMLKVRLQF